MRSGPYLARISFLIRQRMCYFYSPQWISNKFYRWGLIWLQIYLVVGSLTRRVHPHGYLDCTLQYPTMAVITIYRHLKLDKMKTTPHLGLNNTVFLRACALVYKIFIVMIWCSYFYDVKIKKMFTLIFNYQSYSIFLKRTC